MLLLLIVYFFLVLVRPVAVNVSIDRTIIGNFVAG